jgi:hypothetical protein
MLGSPVDFLRYKLGANLPDEALLREFDAGWRTEEMLEWLEASWKLPLSNEKWHLWEVSQKANDYGRYFAGGLANYAVKHETPVPGFLLVYVAGYHFQEAARHEIDRLRMHNILYKYPLPPNSTGDILLELTITPGSRKTGEFALSLAPQDDVSISAHREGEAYWLIGERPIELRDISYALVSARPEGSARSALFYPRMFWNSGSSYELTFGNDYAFIVGTLEDGPDIIEEGRNSERLVKCLLGVAALQRLFAEMAVIAPHRADDYRVLLEPAFALVWETVELCNITWFEVAGVRSDTYAVYELMTHLAALHLASLSLTVARAAADLTDAPPATLERWRGEVARLAPDPDRTIDEYFSEALAALVSAAPLLFAHLAPYVHADTLNDLQARVGGLLPSTDTYDAARLLQQVTAVAAAAFDGKLRHNAALAE